MVKIAAMVMRRKNIEIVMNEARQFHHFVTRPEDTLPRMNPSGLPVPRAPATLFLRRPSGYVANSVPMAGGDTAAVPKPRNPQRMLRAIGLGANAAMSEKRLSAAIPPRSCIFRPKRSAVFPKKSMNEPAPSLRVY
jgi:hypothetical protein